MGNVVDSYMIGNTSIKMCDDCCRTLEEGKKILERIAYTTQTHLYDQYKKQQEETA